MSGEWVMTNKQRLGELLIQQELVSQDTIDQALRTQVSGNRRLGHILVRMKAITDDQLAETLSSQLDIPICDIASKFSPEVTGTVPRYLCRQYGVLPLALKSNNILQLAMADPADEEARNDLENYTGKVIEPYLARHSDIDREIPKRIPLGLKDFFSPRSNTRITRIGVAVCLILVVLLGSFTYQYIHNATYGTVSVAADSVIYKNHDLMLGFDNNGKINFLGRGAFAKGYYSVSFTDQVVLQAFLKSRQADLSDKQKSWIDRVIAKEQIRSPAKSLTAN
jgi:hypothetical protein